MTCVESDLANTNMTFKWEALGPLGTYLGLTGTRLRGREAYDAGVATHYLPSNRVEQLVASVSAACNHHVGVPGRPQGADPATLTRVVGNAIATVASTDDDVAHGEECKCPPRRAYAVAQKT